ncbi:MAG: hypothetical protein HC851_18885 [Acaryochloris sp. RU_4_1]|nr:hypothetical protein [Acaryochloris sp. SU_5_25]NJM67583.1 hypothetical protein [Acaryochloris sp. RU_4_1]NJN39305.1 hypothetical protein [Acaryochloridaceae cyanobacterium CSU_3_4]NJR56341.1 hypothetical protein [Acaryochloris sp. CRU_2_0]
MNPQPNFAMMTTPELRAYVLAHRDDEIALHAYLDKLHSEQPKSRIYNPEENVGAAITEHLHKKPRKAS